MITALFSLTLHPNNKSEWYARRESTKVRYWDFG